ncbi:MAG TPA: lipocalin-like domain-containing protein [Gemmatimonadota bacterium]|nr:lipocalin-like domain-containing protein [Gemmatimonadota bacterium]
MVPFFKLTLAVPSLLVILAYHSPASTVQSALEGVWKVVEVSFTEPDTTGTISNPQASLYIFTKRHYSIMTVVGSEPRALFADPSQPTDAEMLAAYGSFVANSGTYVTTDSTLETHPIVARNPNFMAGESAAFTYRVSGDSLWLTSTEEDPVVEIRRTLLRIE